jgi:uncharacterized membrane protein YhhN
MVFELIVTYLLTYLTFPSFASLSLKLLTQTALQKVTFSNSIISVFLSLCLPAVVHSLLRLPIPIPIPISAEHFMSCLFCSLLSLAQSFYLYCLCLLSFLSPACLLEKGKAGECV